MLLHVFVSEVRVGLRFSRWHCVALHWRKHERVRANMNVRNIFVRFTASAIKGSFGRIHPLVYSQQLPVQQLRSAMPPSHLTVLKWAAKKLLVVPNFRPDQ